jgi:hypothetical protein
MLIQLLEERMEQHGVLVGKVVDGLLTENSIEIGKEKLGCLGEKKIGGINL